MLKKLLIIPMLVFASYLTGCVTVPMAPAKEDTLRKEFATPSKDTAGLYIYRNSIIGSSLKKTISIDG